MTVTSLSMALMQSKRADIQTRREQMPSEQIRDDVYICVSLHASYSYARLKGVEAWG